MAKSRVLQTQENRITRGFGNGHSGVDLGWQTTQTDGILAHSDGKVVFCQTGHKNNPGSSGNASYGNCVKLDHGNNYFTLYAHLSDVAVKLGQQVEKGQIIGHMGNTGNSYGAHLHFEVRNGASHCINPAPYIAADLPGLPTSDPKPENPNTDKEEDDMTYAERMWSIYIYTCLLWSNKKYLTNALVRELFDIPESNKSMASLLINQAQKEKLIAVFDENVGVRSRKYVPAYAKKKAKTDR